jgi:large subunit ribosomal protein L46
LKTSVVLSRAPVLTRSLHPFEKAFYLYQRRLNERLALPFTRYFYYKKGTPADREWKRKAKQRLTPARDIGVYNAYGDNGWNDELLIGDRTSEPEEQVEALIRDAEGLTIGGEAPEGESQKKDTSQDIAVQRPLPRATEADQKGDQTSLNRALDQSLYLLVKNKDGRWRFPEGLIEGREGLHQVSICCRTNAVD